MSDNPLDRIPPYQRLSLRAVLVHEGQDATAAIAQAGFVDPIAIPVIMGEDLDLSGGILGDGLTPNLIAVLETEQQDEFDIASGEQPERAKAEVDDPAPSAPGTTVLSAAHGTGPLAPVRTRR